MSDSAPRPTPGPTPTPRPTAPRTPDTDPGGFTGWLGHTASTLPWWAWPVAVVAVIVVLSMIVRAARSGFSVQTDPQRMFDGNQRTEGRRRCEGRCEHKPMLWRRCDGSADQADHIYPWSKGGSTSVGNLQYLCARHNLSKSDRVPSMLYRWRLERRRRRYFPADAPTGVAWRFGEVPAPRRASVRSADR